MVKEITLRQAGGSLTATLPKGMADHLNLKPQDRIFVIEVSVGMLLTPYDPQFARAMQTYGDGARQYRNALRELAK